jgi:hypothetical protein
MTRSAPYGLVLLLGTIVVLGGCDFMPRILVTSLSPNGQQTAWVWRAPNLDPPDDHLFLKTKGGPPRGLMDLSPDGDWCRTIVWRSDSRKVGFVVSDDRLALFDVETGTLDAFFYLAGTGCCGGPQESRNVTLSADGRQVFFDRWDRPMVRIHRRDARPFTATVSRESSPDLMTTWPLVKPATLVGREVVRVPESRLRLRLVPAPGDRLAPHIVVNVVPTDGRSVGVEATPAPDGLVVLPAVYDGPIDRLEIGMAGLRGKRIVIRELRTGEDVTVVNVPARSAG